MTDGPSPGGVAKSSSDMVKSSSEGKEVQLSSSMMEQLAVSERVEGKQSAGGQWR